MKNILSIRGGGIRGIIPTCCLIKLESQLGGRTRDHIQYCAGTSTGALLTAAVALGIPASSILEVYTERSKEIFTPANSIERGILLAARGFMFEPTNIQKVLNSVFGAQASKVVNDCVIPIMIPAVAINGHNWFFVKDNSKNKQTTGNVKLVDAAVASSCAPTYFDHWKIDNVDAQTIRFFDGGVGGTANPAYQACVEAFEYDVFTPADTRLIDLATGFFPAPSDPPNGLVPVVEWTANTLVDTSEDWVDKAVHRQWPGVMQSVNIELPRNIDEADLTAIPDLVKIGQQLAAGLDWTKLLA